MADMNPILELAEWYENAALSCDEYAEECDEAHESATAGDYRQAAARHRATAAALRAKHAMDCAMASGTLAWVRDTRGLISDPSVLTAIENTNKADDECKRLLKEIR